MCREFERQALEHDRECTAQTARLINAQEAYSRRVNEIRAGIDRAASMAEFNRYDQQLQQLFANLGSAYREVEPAFTNALNQLVDTLQQWRQCKRENPDTFEEGTNPDVVASRLATKCQEASETFAMFSSKIDALELPDNWSKARSVQRTTAEALQRIVQTYQHAESYLTR